jgi:hypothetical protein
MIDLPWSPRWFTSGMSVWAVACRIAHASTAPLRAVIEHLCGATEHWRAKLWFSSHDEGRLVSELDIAIEDERAAFLGAMPEGLEDRQHVCLRLRWCPSCMERWYHSPKFQDMRLTHCPTHGCLLVDLCPYCSRAVDPLGQAAWFCSSCKTTICAPPADWLSDFLAPVAPVRWDTTPEGRVVRSDALLVPKSDLHAPDVADSYRYLAWRQHLLFEDACAVWDTLARGHRECAHGETTAAMSPFHAYEFRCPAAAAVLHTFSRFGVSAEPTHGWHLSLSKVSALYDLRIPLGTPDWALPDIVREFGRSHLRKALLTTARAATLKRQEALALDLGGTGPSITYTTEGALLGSIATEDKLLKALQRAEKFCPKRTVAHL